VLTKWISYVLWFVPKWKRSICILAKCTFLHIDLKIKYKNDFTKFSFSNYVCYNSGVLVTKTCSGWYLFITLCTSQYMVRSAGRSLGYCRRWRYVHNRPVDLNDTPTIQTPYKDINMRAIKRHNTLYYVKYLYIITSLNRYYIVLSQSLGTRNTFAVNFTIKLNEQYTWQKYNKTTYREYASRGSLTLSHVLVCGCWCCCKGRCHYLYAYKLFEHFSDQLSNFQELKFRSK